MAVCGSDWDDNIQVLVDERGGNIFDTDARTTTTNNCQSSMRQIMLAFPKLPRNNVCESKLKAIRILDPPRVCLLEHTKCLYDE